MKLIISLQDGSVQMVSVNQLDRISFSEKAIIIFSAFRDEPIEYNWVDIRSIVIA